MHQDGSRKFWLTNGGGGGEKQTNKKTETKVYTASIAVLSL